MNLDFRDDLEVYTLLYGEDEALDKITIGLIKEDNIECCVCLDNHWGVKLPNCNHFICPKCYYKIYNGYISSKFSYKNPKPKCPREPIYPYKNQDKNKEIFYSITNNETYLEWFVDENQDLYNSVKLNTEFVDNLDVNLKKWFQNNQDIKKYEEDLIKYKNDLEQFYIDIDKYNEIYEEEKEYTSQKICPLCRL
jgi:hypothetical protein